MKNVTGIREPFADKRDKHYFRLTSELSFFDLFTSKGLKCTVPIPEDHRILEVAAEVLAF